MPDYTPPPRILVVRFSSIGDVVLTTPLLRALKARHPDAEITYVTKTEMAPLVADHPAVSRVIALEPGGSLPGLAGRLRRLHFTHRMDLHGTLRAGLLRFLVPGTWSGFDHHRRERRILIATKQDTYTDHRPVAERYFEAAASLDVTPDGKPAELFVSTEAQQTVATWLTEAGMDGKRLAILAPGAAHFTKRWPAEEWVALARRLTADRFAVALVGGDADRPLCEVIASQTGVRAAVAAGRFGLQDTGALLRRAQVAVSGDTGVMHMATASGTPVVALMGPTVHQFGFFPYQARSIVLERPLDCRPCTAHGGPVCPLGHHHCLRQIEAGTVAAAVERLLA